MRVDHFELFVTDRQRAARWYGQVFDFEVVDEYRHWAVDGGPLMISNDGGETMIALFTGRGQGTEPVRGWRRLAFRVAAEELVDFLHSAEERGVGPLGRDDLQDHGKALSVYFSDPDGNRLEVTTYEPEAARRALAR